MKKVATILCLIFLSFSFIFAQERLMISEVADPQDNYNARFVELYNGTGATIDFSTETWYLSRQANGSSWASVQLTGTLAAGGLYRIAYNQAEFESAYGFTPELVSGIITGNGDDGYFLYKNGDYSTGTLVDAYGVIDQDGTGTEWEYLDGHAERNAGVTQANATWTASEWTITRPANTTDMNPNDTSLPVELTSFTANAGNGQVILKWSTASEVNNQGFILLRSEQQDADYSELASYRNDPALAGAGNSSHVINYHFTDRSVINGVTYWYKLVDVDMNGVRTEHGPISATPKANAADPADNNVPQAFFIKNYPNPFNPSTTIAFDLSSFGESEVPVNLTIYDVAGKKVVTLFDGTLNSQMHLFTWNGKDANGRSVPSGLYFYTFRSPFKSVTKKMILTR